MRHHVTRNALDSRLVFGCLKLSMSSTNFTQKGHHVLIWVQSTFPNKYFPFSAAATAAVAAAAAAAAVAAAPQPSPGGGAKKKSNLFTVLDVLTVFEFV